MKLDGKVAIVTGGARGIGAATVKLFSELGARIVCSDVLEEPGRTLAASIGESVSFVPHDVTRGDDWRKVLEHTEALYGPVSVLVNNAGVTGEFLPVQETSEAGYRRAIDINQVGPFLGMRTVTPSMRRAGGGSIINISSALGLVGGANTFAYVASKFAVTGMTKAAALDLGSFGIRVNSVHPGVIETPMNNADATAFKAVAEVASRLPISRVGQPIEMANVIAFLASDASSFCTGASFAADGGWTAS